MKLFTGGYLREVMYIKNLTGQLFLKGGKR